MNKQLAKSLCDLSACFFYLFFLGKVMLASTKAVYILVPLPLERQIQDLLASRRVEEALVLTEGAQRNIPKDKFQVSNSELEFVAKLCGTRMTVSSEYLYI